MSYVPKQGDIIWITLDPQLGHEQKGRRPGLVISNDYFTKMTGLIVLCPITKTDNGFPLHLKLSGYNTYGFIMVEHVKSMDYNERDVEYIEALHQDDLIEVLSVLNACF
ncbi:MAG: type II toxin-antitoxin system PemK/MazF family toxin [Clostridiaceae bacterium]|nr:type II toxin-antitoxin system PemK/MazF family toxin [Clostridiaceae bacterium]